MTTDAPGRTAPRVLVVDDEARNRVLVADILEPEGYEIVTAASGPAALESVHHRAPDLILCDVTMPGMSGLDVCRKLKADERTRYIPFIVVTGLRDKADRVHGIEIGADDYLCKPVDPAELLARVRTTLRLGAYQRIIAEREKFEAAMAEMSDGLVHLTCEWSVLSANTAARRLLDLPDGGVEGIDLLAHLGSRFSILSGEPDLRGGRARQASFEMSRAASDLPPLVLSAALTRVGLGLQAGGDLVLCVRNVTDEHEESRAKDRFIALMSHKLLTPLTILSGHVDLLAHESSLSLSAEQSASLRALERAASELRGFFDRLLGFADLNVNESRIQSTDEPLSRFIRRVETLAEPWRSRRPVEVVVRLPDPDPIVRADVRFMDVVLDNLIHNAVKFGDKDVVRLRVEQVPADGEGCVAMALADNGPGVAPDLRERVFRPFDQIDPDFTGNVEGLGLGLPLARRILETQGGAIRLRSAPRAGTTVILELVAVPGKP
jgi:signal transduction histidine kinase